MVKCCVPLCYNASYRKTPEIAFHRFPKDEYLRTARIKNINRKDWQPNSSVLGKWILTLSNVFGTIRVRKCHSVFQINKLIHQQKPENLKIKHIKIVQFNEAISMVKQHFLSEHVMVRARSMNLQNDQALDEYLHTLLKQGNSLTAMTNDDEMAGICINFASSPVDPKNLRNYAFYRQDPNTKDFLYFTAKLQETPNLWEMFKEPKVFEIKMLAVLPEYRRRGLATMMAEQSIDLAHDQGYNIVRMDCINPYDYKVAERCMLHCVVKFPLHKLRGAHAPFIKRDCAHNCVVRVYAAASTRESPDKFIRCVRQGQAEYANLIE